MLKVSVVIPTYRSGGGLDRALASLDRQTMPQSEFEVLLLDDGSPDDTYERIAALAATHENYRAFRLEPSGWPSRPRNVGVSEARGEYVLFMDHDDELYPRSLRAAYRLAREHDADVVNGKEVRTHKPGWGLSVYTGDTVHTGEEAMRALLPMTPHKLYRRDFLLRHDIRFPEAPRHLWEDLFFNADVVRHQPRVAVLSSTAFYHWRSTGANNSSAADGSLMDYGGDPEYWTYLDKLLRHVSTVPAGPARKGLLAQNAAARLVSQLGRRLSEANAEERAQVVAHVRDALETCVPVEVEAAMAPRARTAIRLFRAGFVEEANAFLRHGEDHAITAQVERVAGGPVARIEGTVTWRAPEDAPALLTDDGALGPVRAFSPEVRAALAAVQVSAAADLENTSATVVLRHRKLRSAWTQPTGTTVRLVPDHDGLGLSLEFTADIDPEAGAVGHRLPAGRYDVYVQVDVDGRQALRRALIDAQVTVNDLGDTVDRVGVTRDSRGRAEVVVGPPVPPAPPTPAPARPARAGLPQRALRRVRRVVSR